MSFDQTITGNDIWLNQIFASEAAKSGGVVRRSIEDVERKVGRRAVELAVRQRGWHLIECGGQFVIVCSREQVRIIV
jgi:hypothetical protein